MYKIPLKIAGSALLVYIIFIIDGQFPGTRSVTDAYVRLFTLFYLLPLIKLILMGVVRFLNKLKPTDLLKPVTNWANTPIVDPISSMIAFISVQALYTVALGYSYELNDRLQLLIVMAEIMAVIAGLTYWFQHKKVKIWKTIRQTFEKLKGKKMD